MHSTKASQSTARRASMPASVGARRISATSTPSKTTVPPKQTQSQTKATTATKSTPASTAAASTSTPASTTSAQATSAAPSPTQHHSTTTSSGEMSHKLPVVMTPVSQLPRDGRRASQPRVPISDRQAAWDPEHYNPDGSLRTMHKMPGFDQSYAQAMKARYIRHTETLDKERELSVNEIFGRKDPK